MFSSSIVWSSRYRTNSVDRSWVADPVWVSYSGHGLESWRERARLPLQTDPNGQSERPLEEVTFTYSKVTWKYSAIDPHSDSSKGDTMSYWDLIQNMGG